MGLFDKDEKKKSKRFVVKEEQALAMGAVQIIVDTATGVNYMNVLGGAMNGLTPLLDSNGNVIIDKTDK